MSFIIMILCGETIRTEWRDTFGSSHFARSDPGFIKGVITHDIVRQLDIYRSNSSIDCVHRIWPNLLFQSLPANSSLIQYSIRR